VKLSACLIVRNEQDRITRCLRSIRAHVDEIIVLDTGSTDQTMELARLEGADIVASEPHRTVDIGEGFQSLGDFAAARNRSIELASGDFVLIVDADHIYVPPTFLAIRKTMCRDDVHAAALKYHIADKQSAKPLDVVTGKARLGQPFAAVALMRRKDGPHYSGIIHELPTEWLRRREAEGTKQALLPESRIADFGHEPVTRAAIGKDRRNELLLKRAITLDPDNPVPYTYLAGTYVAAERWDDAADTVSDVYDKIGKDDRLAGAHLLRLCVAMGLIGFHARDPGLTWHAARTWEQSDGRPHPDVDTLKGLAVEMKGMIKEARVFYQLATTRDAASVGCQHIVSNTAADRLKAIDAATKASAA
jgi:glycosyltransferase involved in cell wall biosynthesis